MEAMHNDTSAWYLLYNVQLLNAVTAGLEQGSTIAIWAQYINYWIQRFKRDHSRGALSVLIIAVFQE